MIKINKWNFNEEIVLEIGKFAILWNIFESQKCDNSCSNKKLEQISVSCSENWLKFSAELLKRANGDIDDYVNNGLSLGGGLREGEKNKVKEFLKSEGKLNLVGGLIAIFRIRNNMFHGLKEWKDLNNQLNLFKTINLILKEII